MNNRINNKRVFVNESIIFRKGDVVTLPGLPTFRCGYAGEVGGVAKPQIVFVPEKDAYRVDIIGISEGMEIITGMGGKVGATSVEVLAVAKNLGVLNGHTVYRVELTCWEA